MLPILATTCTLPPRLPPPSLHHRLFLCCHSYHAEEASLEQQEVKDEQSWSNKIGGKQSTGMLFTAITEGKYGGVVVVLMDKLMFTV